MFIEPLYQGRVSVGGGKGSKISWKCLSLEFTRVCSMTRFNQLHGLDSLRFIQY